MKEETGNNEIKPKAETADVGQTTDEESVNVGKLLNLRRRHVRS